MPPIIQDQTYVLGGGIEWFKYLFADPGIDALGNNCLLKTKFNIIVKHPNGEISGPPLGFISHNRENRWIRVEGTD